MCLHTVFHVLNTRTKCAAQQCIIKQLNKHCSVIYIKQTLLFPSKKKKTNKQTNTTFVKYRFIDVECCEMKR